MRISYLLLCLCLGSAVAKADDELNLSFMSNAQGKLTDMPSVLKHTTPYAEGVYSVDVKLNGVNRGQRVIDVNVDEAYEGQLCLSSDWLANAGIAIDLTQYETLFNKGLQCYWLGDHEFTSVALNLQELQLNINVPQQYVLGADTNTKWSSGVTAAKLRYQANANTTVDDEVMGFAMVEFGANMGDWRFDSRFTANSSGDSTDINASELVFTRPMDELQGELVIGRKQIYSDLYDGFGFYGIGLFSNDDMRPVGQDRYSPDIRGVATSVTRITVKQGGQVIHSEVVQPGPYLLTDVRPISYQDLEVSAIFEDGSEQVTLYPMSSLQTLLRPGQYNYSFAVGTKNQPGELSESFMSDEGVFALAEVDYGLNNMTISGAAILHEQYVNTKLGLTRTLGDFGAVAIDVGVSSAEFDTGYGAEGFTAGFKYSKSFVGNTNLQLLAYRYESGDYLDFAEFDPSDSLVELNRNKRKARYEMSLSHRFDSASLSLSAWSQEYWDRSGTDIGVTGSLSTNLWDRIPVSFNANYLERAQGERDYFASVNVSIPFELFGNTAFSSSNVSYGVDGAVSAGTTVSGRVNERLGYSVSARTSSEDSHSGGGSLSYQFDAMNVAAGVNTNDYGTTYTGSISGSAILTPELGLVATRYQDDTIGLIHMSGAAGAKVNSQEVGESGIVAVGLNGYSKNSLHIDTSEMASDVEIGVVDNHLTPRNKVVEVKHIKVNKVNRLLLRVYQRDGRHLSSGSVLSSGVQVGEIAPNGVLMMSLKNSPDSLQVETSFGVCAIQLTAVKANHNKLQEVYCE